MIQRPQKRITEMYAFTTIDDHGDEGVMAFLNPVNGTWMPMVGADCERVRSLIPTADRMAKEFGRPYRIKRFAPADPHDVTDQYK